MFDILLLHSMPSTLQIILQFNILRIGKNITAPYPKNRKVLTPLR